MPKAMFGVVICFAAGIWLAKVLAIALMPLYVLIVVLFGAAGYAVWRGSRYVLPLVLGLFFIAGMIRFIHVEQISAIDISRWGGRVITVQGMVTELPQCYEADGQVVVKYVVGIDQVVDGSDNSHPAVGNLMVTFRQAGNERVAAYGDRVQVTGEIAPINGLKNPGQVDNIASMRLRGITAKLNARKGHFTICSVKNGGWQAIISQGRQRAAAGINQAMSESDAAILNGVLFGGYIGINRQVVQDFSVTGLVHILSVSGTHIALVAGVVAWLGGMLGLGTGKTALISAVALAGYAVFAGLTAPVVRSVIMGLTALAAIGLRRDNNAFQAIVIAALGMLIYQPALLFDISFELSFGASGGLILFYAKTKETLSFLPCCLRSAAAVTWAAELGVLPVVAWYFNAFPVSSFIANLLVLPIIEMVVVVGLLGIIGAAVWPLGGKILLVGCALLLGTATKMTALIALLPFSRVYLPTMGGMFGAGYYLILAWIYGYLPPRVPTLLQVLARWPTKATVGVLAIIIGGFIYLYYPRPVAVHFIDVGQGDSSLIITPHGYSVLVDCGGSNNDVFDIGERVVVPYLHHYGVTRVDYLILTHGHQDHAGGAAGVAAAVPVRHIVMPAGDDSAAIKALMKVSPASQVITAVSGQTISLDGVTFKMVHTDGGGSIEQENERSNVILVCYGRHSFLITGDVGAEGERAMLRHGLGTGTVLKVAHHGAKTSSTAQFLKEFSPQFAIISVGHNNFGHPHKETLERLSQQQIKILRTDDDGAVVFTTNGTSLSVTTFKQEQAKFNFEN
ncbi:MAG: comEC 2 [Firmicutes bacterium]|nr:comEC 2 [Bacillota bacterium]